ncbi:MAG: alpha/beta fold hydrolase [Pseudomonadota bacterium]
MVDSVTLFCLPFAGGNAYSYRSLEEHLSPPIKVVPLEPPGRGRRIKETPLSSLPAIVIDLIDSMRPSLDKPFALFGHSLGALAAFLVTSRLNEEQLPLPAHLFLSGKGPPHRSPPEAGWHTLPLDEFKRKLAELGGSPAAVLANQELMDYFTPIIRQDLRILAEYEYTPVSPLNVPITVMIGTGERTTRAEALEWSDLTTSECRVLQYEGSHFFLFDHLDDICALIRSTLIDS